MTQSDLKKRTRKSTKNEEDSLNKPKPKKGRGKAIEKEEANEDNAVSEEIIMASFETNVSSNDIEVEDGGSKGKRLLSEPFQLDVKSHLFKFFIINSTNIKKMDARTTFAIN